MKCVLLHRDRTGVTEGILCADGGNIHSRVHLENQNLLQILNCVFMNMFSNVLVGI